MKSAQQQEHQKDQQNAKEVQKKEKKFSPASGATWGTLNLPVPEVKKEAPKPVQKPEKKRGDKKRNNNGRDNKFQTYVPKYEQEGEQKPVEKAPEQPVVEEKKEEPVVEQVEKNEIVEPKPVEPVVVQIPQPVVEEIPVVVEEPKQEEEEKKRLYFGEFKNGVIVPAEHIVPQIGDEYVPVLVYIPKAQTKAEGFEETFGKKSVSE